MSNKKSFLSKKLLKLTLICLTLSIFFTGVTFLPLYAEVAYSYDTYKKYDSKVVAEQIIVAEQIVIDPCSNQNIKIKYPWVEAETVKYSEDKIYKKYDNNVASVFCYEKGIFEISGGIQNEWVKTGEAQSYLGFPISEKIAIDEFTEYVNFQRGVICENKSVGVWSINNGNGSDCQPKKNWTYATITDLSGYDAHTEPNKSVFLLDRTNAVMSEFIHIRVSDPAAIQDGELMWLMYAPNGNVVSVGKGDITEIAPDAGIFEIDFKVELPPLWKGEKPYLYLTYTRGGTEVTTSTHIALISKNDVQVTEEYAEIDWRPKMDSKVFELVNKINPETYAFSKLIPFDDTTNKVRLVVEMDDLQGVKQFVSENDGTIEANSGDKVQITIPIKETGKLSQISGLRYVHAPIPLFQHQIESEGVSFINANKAHALGFTGEGVKIAVLDLAFDENNEEIKKNVKGVISYRYDFDGKKIDVIGNLDEAKHGTAVAEIIVDVAPDVELFLYSISTEVEFLNAMDSIAKNNEIDIVTMSAGYLHHLTNGQSAITQKISEVAEKQIVILSAGNYRQTHWEGGYDEFSSIQKFSVTVHQERVDKKEPIWLFLLWENSDVDFDLFLKYCKNQGINSCEDVDFSVNRQGEGYLNNLEVISHIPKHAGEYKLEIAYADSIGTSNSHLELFSPTEKRFDVYKPIGSSPVPTDAANIITVGAFNFKDNKIEEFSSEGPTNNGESVPKIFAPNSVQTSLHTPENPFTGTSAAAPHIAGLAALLIEQNKELSPRDVTTIMQDSANKISDNRSSDVLDVGLANINIEEDEESRDSVVVEEASTVEEILHEVKDKMGQWVDDSTLDSNFTDAIKHLMEKEIIADPKHNAQNTQSTSQIPKWIKILSQWWTADKISNEEFVKAIDFLVKKEIISIA